MDSPTSTFNQAETITFFTDVIMANATTHLRLADEGITTVVDLFHYDDDMIGQVVRNLRKSNGDDVDVDGAVIAIPAVAVSAITVDRLKKFAKAIRWFADISRPINPETMTVSVALILDKALDSLLDKRKNDSSTAREFFHFFHYIQPFF